jgi:hypothetical protein
MRVDRLMFYIHPVQDTCYYVLMRRGCFIFEFILFVRKSDQ